MRDTIKVTMVKMTQEQVDLLMKKNKIECLDDLQGKIIICNIEGKYFLADASEDVRYFLKYTPIDILNENQSN